jgi:hypothetical protein
MRKGHHDFEIGDIPFKNAADASAISQPGDPFIAHVIARAAALLWWQEGAVAMGNIHILSRAAPVQIACIMRLVIGAAFIQDVGGGRQNARKGRCPKREDEG